MKKTSIISIAVIVICVFLALLVSFAGSDGGARIANTPVFIVCSVLAFAINWIAYVPANLQKTEHFYDLTGSITYLTVVVAAIVLSGDISTRAAIVAVMVSIWAVRLGTFLFTRIRRDGKDDRFDNIKHNPLRFFVTWTLQALWVVLTSACALAIITGGDKTGMDAIAWVGFAVWLGGFCIEIIADRQKSQFKRNTDNAGKFISSGLWAWSRHPNYFGEILLWLGISVMAVSVLHGWQWICLISPIFVYVLIKYVSGVNKLEAKAEQKWGDDPEYRMYKVNTPELFLKRPIR